MKLLSTIAVLLPYVAAQDCSSAPPDCTPPGGTCVPYYACLSASTYSPALCGSGPNAQGIPDQIPASCWSCLNLAPCFAVPAPPPPPPAREVLDHDEVTFSFHIYGNEQCTGAPIGGGSVDHFPIGPNNICRPRPALTPTGDTYSSGHCALTAHPYEFRGIFFPSSTSCQSIDQDGDGQPDAPLNFAAPADGSGCLPPGDGTGYRFTCTPKTHTLANTAWNAGQAWDPRRQGAQNRKAATDRRQGGDDHREKQAALFHSLQQARQAKHHP